MSVTWDDTVSTGETIDASWGNDIISAIKRRGPIYVVSRDAYGDYYCDGTDDDVQIQAAIDALGGSPGSVMLREQYTYNITSSLTIEADDVTLFSLGAGAKIFSHGATNRQMLTIGDGSTNYQNIKVLNLEFDGNRANKTADLAIPYAGLIRPRKVTDVEISGCYIHSGRSCGIESDPDVTEARLIIMGNHFEDFLQVTTANCDTGVDLIDTNHCIVAHNTFIDCDNAGVWCADSDHITVAHNVIQNSTRGKYGIGLSYQGTSGPYGCHACNVSDNTINAVDDMAIYLYGTASKFNTIANNTIYGGLDSGSYLTGILIWGNATYGYPTYNNIHDNMIYGSGTASSYGIREVDDSNDYNLIHHNIIDNVAADNAISRLGLHTCVDHNIVDNAEVQWAKRW